MTSLLKRLRSVVSSVSSTRKQNGTNQPNYEHGVRQYWRTPLLSIVLLNMIFPYESIGLCKEICTFVPRIEIVDELLQSVHT